VLEGFGAPGGGDVGGVEEIFCAPGDAVEWAAIVAGGDLSVGGFGSISDTLQHFVRSERSYFSRISTGQPYRHPEGAPPLTFAEMAESLHHSGEGLIEWAPKVQATDSVEVQWDNEPLVHVPKAVLLTQAINHATEHRAQIMAILTQLGIQPPDLDGWSYFEAQRLK